MSSPRRPITLLTSAPINDLPLSPPSSSSSSSTDFRSHQQQYQHQHQLKLQLTPPTPTTPQSSWSRSPSSPSSPSNNHLRRTLPVLSNSVYRLRSLLSSSLRRLSSRSEEGEDEYEEDDDGGILPSHSPVQGAHRPSLRRRVGGGRSGLRLVTTLVFWGCFLFWATALMGE